MIRLALADSFAPRFLGFAQVWDWDLSGLLGSVEWRGRTYRVWRFCLVLDRVRR